jgi:formylglycine-generating enzyme required for sulfatase activity
MADGGNGCGKKRTWPVCSKPAGNTPQGLCDMSGNVFEWVSDWYAESYRGAGSKNPKGVSHGEYRVFRGGSWNVSGNYLRAADRSGRDSPVSRSVILGFRCARTP